jgi:putative Holliday junction resolvase
MAALYEENCIFWNIQFDIFEWRDYIISMTRVLAIDYGRRRIGVAFSDPDRIIVSHQETILISGYKDVVRKLVDYVCKSEIGEIVIGYPYRQDGSLGPLAHDIDRLCAYLRKRFTDIPVELLDERYTSLLAIRYLHESGRKVGDDKGRVDSMAAAILLEEYITRKRGDE